MRTRVEGNGVLVTSRCGFRGPGMNSRCDQPVGLVISPEGRRTYVFPPDWEAMNELPLDLLIARYARVSPNQAREWRRNR